MRIDRNKLKNLKEQDDKITAQCPACAEDGKDSKGDHLVIYRNGRFGCVVKKSKAHRKRIFELVGQTGSFKSGGPIPVRIRRPDCVTRTPRTILVLNSLIDHLKIKQSLATLKGNTLPPTGLPDTGAAPSEMQSTEGPSDPSLTTADAETLMPAWRFVPLNPGNLTVVLPETPDVDEQIQFHRNEYAKDGVAYLSKGDFVTVE
jgi:hypothetical protein